MADLEKQSNPSRPGDEGGTTIEARFDHFCKNDLKMGDNFLAQATKLFDETKNLLLSNISALGINALDEAEKYWFAFIIYLVRRLNESVGPVENGLPLCQILRAARLNVVDFYKELHQFLIKVGSVLSNLYGDNWERRLEAKESQTDFVHLTLLSKKYERAYQDLFLILPNNDEHSNDANTFGLRPDHYRFGWLLFLALRVHVFHLCKDLVTCTHGLVSVLVSYF